MLSIGGNLPMRGPTACSCGIRSVTILDEICGLYGPEVLGEERIMNPQTRLTGEPIMRILCKKTDTLVGYLYQWNNGDLQPAWLDTAKADVRYEPISAAA